MLSNRTLLVLAPGFPDKTDTFLRGIFVKEQLKYIKKYFKKIVVVIPIIRSFGVKEEDRFCKDYGFDNVEIYFPRFWHFPSSYFRERLYENQFLAVDELIVNRRIDFDLIHAHFTRPSGDIGVKLKQKYNKPLVLTVHEDSEWLGREVSSQDEKLVLVWNSSNFIIRVNRKDISLLKQYNRNIVAIPNGFSKEKFRPLNKLLCRKELNLPEEKKILLSLGFLVEQKGHRYAIDAVKKVVEKKSNILYLIAGSGILKDTLQKKVNELGLQSNVRLLGFVPSEKICLLMNACDLFVLPSISEGNPTVMFEALGCGRPVIGTSVGGVPEIITKDSFGFLVNPGNSEDLADKLLRGLNKRYSEKQIHSYGIRFTWEKIAQDIAGIYEKVLL